MQGVKEQIIEPLINNPKMQTTMGSVMVALAADAHIIKSLNIYLTFVGGILGIILTSIMIYKNLKQAKK